MCHIKKSQYEKQDIQRFVYILSLISVFSFNIYFLKTLLLNIIKKGK